MESAIRVPPSLGFKRRLLDSGTSQKERSVTPCPRVLLVGQELTWGIGLLKSLERFGGEFFFAPPLRVTSEYVRTGEYTLVLIDSSVPPEFRKQLVSILIGSDAFIFYAYPVENGCWWVPALFSGEDCHGSPAFRTKQFLTEVEHILRNKKPA